MMAKLARDCILALGLSLLYWIALFTFLVSSSFIREFRYMGF